MLKVEVNNKSINEVLREEKIRFFEIKSKIVENLGQYVFKNIVQLLKVKISLSESLYKLSKVKEEQELFDQLSLVLKNTEDKIENILSSIFSKDEIFSIIHIYNIYFLNEKIL